MAVPLWGSAHLPSHSDARPAWEPGLPIPRTPLLGRDDELTRALTLLQRDDVGLLTLIGTGGAGKTRLALALAERARHEHAARVVFVALAPLIEQDQVVPTIARTLGLPEAARRSPFDAIVEAIEADKLLLVLDNFEHLLDAAPEVADLIVRCPDLTVLATSREPLRVRGEHLLAVPPLAAPDPGRLPELAELGSYSAITLFLDRAQAVRPDFSLTAENAESIARICHRLDGLPLALELAAARTLVLTPQALLARLDQRLTLLTGGPRDLPDRQRSLYSTIAWSFDLLSPAEQVVFRRLAVFAGGWTLEAAEAVCEGGARDEWRRVHREAQPSLLDPHPSTQDILGSLVAKSLVYEETRPDGTYRFGMLETVREFALEKLRAAGDEEATRRRLVLHLTTILHTAAHDPELHRPGLWLQRVLDEHANFWTALRWTVERGEAELGLSLLGAFHRWGFRDAANELRRWGQALLALPVASPRTLTRARALYVLGDVAWSQGDSVVTRAWWEESASICRELGDRRGLGTALSSLGWAMNEHLAPALALIEEGVAALRETEYSHDLATALIRLGSLHVIHHDAASALPAFEESRRLYRASGDDVVGVKPYTGLGQVAFLEGDYEAARRHLSHCIPVYRQFDVPLDLVPALHYLGLSALELGELDEAEGSHLEIVTIARGNRNPMHMMLGFCVLASVAMRRGRPDRAAILLGAADRLRGDHHVTIGRHGPWLFRDRDALRRDLGDTRFDARWSEGRSMSQGQVVELALQQDVSPELTPVPQPQAVSSPTAASSVPILPDPLTRREIEVLGLVAAGHSNREIADELVLSIRTVEHHIERIYRKIDVRGRVEAAAWALRHGLTG